MTEVSNDLPGVAQFLYSPNGMNEFLSQENVIQTSENLFTEELEPNVIRHLDSNQEFQMLDQELSYNPETPTTNSSNLTLDQKIQGDTFQTLYPNLTSSCNPFSTSKTTDQCDNLQSEISTLNSSNNINAISSSNSNEVVYQSLSTVQCHQNGTPQTQTNQILINQPMYSTSSGSPESAFVQSSTPSLSQNNRSSTFSSTDEGQQHYHQSQSSQSFNVLQTMIPSFPLKGYAPQNNDPLVLVPLSMLQLGRLKSVTSPQTILQSPTRSSSTSETENEARKSQNNRNLTLAPQKRSSYNVQGQHHDEDIHCREKVFKTVLKRKVSIHNNKKTKRNIKKMPKTIIEDTEMKFSSPKKSKVKPIVNEIPEIDSTLCKVCGEEATKYIHYGGRSCASCRAFFRRSVESAKRCRGFRYFCNCVENCWKKEEPICDVNKLTRNNCKYCRYEKCMNRAGMNSQWVISAHIPKVERKPSKRDVASKAKIVSVSKGEDENDLLKNIESIYGLSDNPSSELLELTYEFKLEVEDGKREMTNGLQDGIVEFNNKMISSRSMTVPEFSRLKPSNRTGLLKKNFVAMLRLGVIEFLYDVISIESRSSFAILSDMYIIWETSFWKNKSFCQPPSSTMEMKRLIRKILELVDSNKKIFSFLFPIILFRTPVDKDSETQHHTSTQLAYMQLLKDRLMIHSNEDHECAAVQLGVANEILNYLHHY